MKKEQFKTTINAPKEKVWKTLWGDETYPQWTSAFSEGSKVETDWKEGSRITFLNAENEGMIAVIADKRDNEFMSFKHIGMIDKNRKEDFESEQVKAWAGSLENYTLKNVNGKTEVIVDMDVDDKYEDFFKETWPKAMEKLKELSEK